LSTIKGKASPLGQVGRAGTEFHVPERLLEITIQAG